MNGTYLCIHYCCVVLYRMHCIFFLSSCSYRSATSLLCCNYDQSNHFNLSPLSHSLSLPLSLNNKPYRQVIFFTLSFLLFLSHTLIFTLSSPLTSTHFIILSSHLVFLFFRICSNFEDERIRSEIFSRNALPGRP